MSNNQNKMSFSPINNAHSITEMVAYLQYQTNFDKSIIQNLSLLQEDLKEELPIFSQIYKREYEIRTNQSEKINGTNLKDSLSGVELKKLNKDNQLEWVLKTTENTIGVHCLDYARWDETIEKMMFIFNKIFNRLNIDLQNVSKIGLMVIDKYISNSSIKKSNLSDLIHHDTKWIFAKAFESSNKFWHSHVGLYSKVNNTPCLNQLNVNADPAPAPDDKLIVNIRHNAVVEKVEINSNEDVISFLNKLHKNNKNVLKNVLSANMATRISL